jgi:F-type H+-transporting ATPase subunit b
MQIDWLTVAAQVVNFLILVYLLKRFLYQPVIDAMSRREQRITDRLQESREREEQAEHERERLHRRLEQLEARRDEIMDQAREKAEQERQRLLDEARDESEAARKRWRGQAEDEKDRFLEGLRRETTQGFEQLARKALTDLADAALEEQVVRRFIARLDALDEDVRRQLASASDDEQALEVRTSFALAKAQRRQLAEAIRQKLGVERDLVYRESSELLCGIELGVGGRRIGWSLGEYLDRFEKRLGNAVGAAPA